MSRYGIVTLLVVATLSAGQARADVLLKIPGIPGTSTLEGHENEIVLSSLQFGGGQVVPRSGPKPCAGPSSKMELSEFSVRFRSVQFVHTDPSDGEESVTWSVCG